MPRPKGPSASLKSFEDEKRRALVIDLHKAGKSLSHIAGEVEKVFKKPCARSTVQYIIKAFKDRPTMARKVPKPKKSKMTKQYDLFCPLLT